MDTLSTHKLLEPVIWSLPYWGKQIVMPGQHYDLDNHARNPVNIAACQIVTAGRLHFTCNQKTRVILPGQAFLFMYGEASHYWHDPTETEPVKFVWVSIAGAGIAEHWQALYRSYGPVLDIGLKSPLIQQMKTLWEAATPLAHRTPLHLAMAVQKFVIQIFQAAQQFHLKDESAVHLAVNHIIEQPIYTLSLKEIAFKFGCSREHLTRTFQRLIGQSPAAYIANARLARAKQLLRETNLPLKTVAKQSGFHALHTFNRNVRQHAKQTPSQWRQQLEQESIATEIYRKKQSL